MRSAPHRIGVRASSIATCAPALPACPYRFFRYKGGGGLLHTCSFGPSLFWSPAPSIEFMDPLPRGGPRALPCSSACLTQPRRSWLRSGVVAEARLPSSWTPRCVDEAETRAENWRRPSRASWRTALTTSAPICARIGLRRHFPMRTRRLCTGAIRFLSRSFYVAELKSRARRPSSI